MAKVALLPAGSLPAIPLPAGMTEQSVGAAYYLGDPSPAALDKAVADKATDETFQAKAKYLKEAWGVQSAGLLLAIWDKITVQDVPPPAPPAPPGP